MCSTEVWYGCCRLLVVMSSLHALSPPPLWGGACGRFGWPRPPVWGSVFYRDMVWLLPLVSSTVIAARSLPYKNMMLLFSRCKRCPCPCSDAVLGSCEEALAGTSLHRPPSLWFWGSFFRLPVRLCGSLGVGGRGLGGGGGWGGRGGREWGPGSRQPKKKGVFFGLHVSAKACLLPQGLNFQQKASKACGCFAVATLLLRGSWNLVT